MPIFSYICNKCSFSFEHLVGVTAEPNELKCPACGHLEVTKKMATFAVRNSSGQSECTTGACSTGTCPTCY
ncbi:MAG: hypothetical protein MUP70_09505 [Candidatus Aminicenantes bacterium]|nr:hypothetical protein [Candidatus Aminicenantes bacterium]